MSAGSPFPLEFPPLAILLVQHRIRRRIVGEGQLLAELRLLERVPADELDDRLRALDDLQGDVGASWAKSLGATKVYVLDDTEIYGKGIADVFEASAKADGLP